ncbi:RluA family pseudouridine synthase [Candidatus Daviesbacteria bacterium]|nr:RluA family pseudouridine synthase [Candidatus Daviesbacteria bacterium]
MQSIRVVFEDKSLLIIEKPSGLIVTPTETSTDETVAEVVQKQFGINLDRGGIVHRLDKDTSGLLIIAKTVQSLENLQAQFKKRVVKKEYLALVHGFLEKAGKVVGAIARNPKNREKFIVSGGGREAETEYEPIDKFQIPNDKLQIIFADFNKIQMRKLERTDYGKFTLLRCFPLTGRTHQIRVHLKYIGFPIVADEKYGGRKTARLDRRWCPRQFLHASRIEFNHPVSGKRMTFESPLPEDLMKALKMLGERKFE